MKPRPLHILVCSQSDATLAFLNTMFIGFSVTLVSSIEQAQGCLEAYSPLSQALDFIILDDQSETHADELVRSLRSLPFATVQETKVIHLYTPTTSSSGHAVFSSNTPGVIKMTKPPRRLRMLQTLAGLKDLPNTISSNPATDVAKAMEDLAAAQRTLYGNVLIAEGMPAFITRLQVQFVTHNSSR